MEVKLSVLAGKHKGRQIPLPETIFLIGRGSECHLRPHCQGVSKLHCAIAAWAGKVRVRDLKSRNGTYLNGRAIQGEVVVRDGDQLQVGTLLFAFDVKHDEGSPRVAPLEDERELDWLLLDPPPDSAVLQAPTLTGIVSQSEVASDNGQTKDEADPQATTPGSKAISGGQHLRAYVKQRKRQRPPAEGAE